MNLETKYKLSINHGERFIGEGDEIKIFLKNGEILIGEYQSSDWTSLDIERNSDDINIEFEEIEDIEVL